MSKEADNMNIKGKMKKIITFYIPHIIKGIYQTHIFPHNLIC